MTAGTAGIACALAAVVGSGAVAQITPSPRRADQMHEQFQAVTAAHEAIIRGNLQDAKNQARMVARFPDPVSLPKTAAPYLAAMRAAAGQATVAADLLGAASATATMLATCGDCHRAVGTMPAHPPPPEARVGGVIGHMITHQAAMDLLLQALTTPSTSLWNQGADALAVAPLAKSKLPSDAKVSGEIMKSEKHIHALAAQARQAEDTASRVAVYSELIQSCASCHGENDKGYGPEFR
jgi:mono/diheme cytochrome c family protein